MTRFEGQQVVKQFSWEAWGVNFSQGKVNVTPASLEQCSRLQQSHWCRYWFFFAAHRSSDSQCFSMCWTTHKHCQGQALDSRGQNFILNAKDSSFETKTKELILKNRLNHRYQDQTQHKVQGSKALSCKTKRNDFKTWLSKSRTWHSSLQLQREMT